MSLATLTLRNPLPAAEQRGWETVIDGTTIRSTRHIGNTGLISTSMGRTPFQPILEVAASLYPRQDNDALTAGEKVTLLMVSDGVFGGISVAIRQVTLFDSSSGSGLGMLPKGRRTKGYQLKLENVLDVARGWDKAHIATFTQRWQEAVSQAPSPIVNTTAIADAIDALPEYAELEAPATEIGAAMMVSHPGFDGTGAVKGCVWFFTDKMTGDKPSETILNGYLWVPPTGLLESEHGSIVAGDLRGSWHPTVIDVAPGLSFRDCWDLPVNPAGMFAVIAN